MLAYGGMSQAEAQRVATEARQYCREQGLTRFAQFRAELKKRGLKVESARAAELYHAIEVMPSGGAHSQIAAALGGAELQGSPPGARSVRRRVTRS